MSINFQKKVVAFKNKPFNVEVFESADEVVKVSANRSRTDRSFHDMSNPSEVDRHFTGVDSLDEALEMMRSGYQPTVDKLKSGIKANVSGQGKRVVQRQTSDVGTDVGLEHDRAADIQRQNENDKNDKADDRTRQTTIVLLESALFTGS